MIPEASKPLSGVKFKALAVFLLVLTATTLAPARADYNIRVVGGNVLVTITGEFVQGISNNSSQETFPFGPIPIFQPTNLQGENASYLSTILTRAIRVKTPSAYADQVKFSANSNGTSMNYALSFRVGNTSRLKDDGQTV